MKNNGGGNLQLEGGSLSGVDMPGVSSLQIHHYWY